MNWPLVWGLFGLLMPLGSRLAAAGERQFVLREHVGRTWRDELITFTFEAADGECHPASLRLRGRSGPVPVQIVRREAWPGQQGFVRTARVSFFADLDALQTETFTLSFGPDPGPAPEPNPGLQLRQEEDKVSVRSRFFGAEFFVGRRAYATPQAAADVPGPLGSFMMADGTRFGGSEMFGPTAIAECEGELVAAGPVFAEMRWRYRYADGASFQLRARLGERDAAVYWDMAVDRHAVNDGWRLLMTKGDRPLTFSVQMEHFSQRPYFVKTGAKLGDWAHLPLGGEPEGIVTRLTPWADWVNDGTQAAMLLQDEQTGERLCIASRDPGAWVVPVHRDMPLVKLIGDNGGAFGKRMIVRKLPGGAVGLEANLVCDPGGPIRRWITGRLRPHEWHVIEALIASRAPLPPSAPTKFLDRAIQESVDRRRLDVVKDFVLDWPREPGSERPKLFATAADMRRLRRNRQTPRAVEDRLPELTSGSIPEFPGEADGLALAAYLCSGDRRLAVRCRLADRLRQHLGRLGEIDLLRGVPLVCAMYDGIVDSDLVTAAERPLLDAQMAFLGYRMADPAVWSLDRGYNAGTANMSVSFILGLGVIACTIPDHPAAPGWFEPARRRMLYWLENDVGDRGEWMEGSHYDQVTGSMFLAFALAARNAGFQDFTSHPKFRAMMRYIAVQYTPPDPMRGGFRASPPLGRANSGDRLGLAGLMARITAADDPEYSAAMQWMWQQAGAPTKVYDSRLGGTEFAVLDSRLPARRPVVRSEDFPRSNVLLRHGYGAAEEHYLSLAMVGDAPFIRPSEVGSILAWFAHGQPIAGAFTGGYDDRHELMTSRVSPARSPSAQQWRDATWHAMTGGVKRCVLQPRLDYCDAEFTIGKEGTAGWAMPADMPAWPPGPASSGTGDIAWRRQMLFVKGADAAAPSYLVLRDTVRGNRPTMWQFWTVTDGIVPGGGPARGTATLAGQTPSSARELRGNQFTGRGRFGVDVDLHIVSPRETPRHTLRWGKTYDDPVKGVADYRDLLHLSLEGDGSYVVVAFPRKREDPAPRVRSLAGDAVLEVSGPWGVDVVVLGTEPVEARLEGVRLRALAGCIQRRHNGGVVCLAEGKEVTSGDVTVTGPGPGSVARP
jgi:hypothetical protein